MFWVHAFIWGQLLPEPINLLTFVVEFANTFDLGHVGTANSLHEVKVPQSVKAASLALIEHHFVFVHRCVGGNEEHDVTRVKFFANIAVKITVDHSRLISDQALIQHFFVFELLGLVLRQDHDFQIQVFMLRSEFDQLVRGGFLGELPERGWDGDLLLGLHFSLSLKIT